MSSSSSASQLISSKPGSLLFCFPDHTVTGNVKSWLSRIGDKSSGSHTTKGAEHKMYRGKTYDDLTSKMFQNRVEKLIGARTEFPSQEERTDFVNTNLQIINDSGGSTDFTAHNVSSSTMKALDTCYKLSDSEPLSTKAGFVVLGIEKNEAGMETVKSIGTHIREHPVEEIDAAREFCVDSLAWSCLVSQADIDLIKMNARKYQNCTLVTIDHNDMEALFKADIIEHFKSLRKPGLQISSTVDKSQASPRSPQTATVKIDISAEDAVVPPVYRRESQAAGDPEEDWWGDEDWQPEDIPVHMALTKEI